MGIDIDDPEVCQIEELARVYGENLEEAVLNAVRERLDRIQQQIGSDRK